KRLVKAFNPKKSLIEGIPEGCYTVSFLLEAGFAYHLDSVCIKTGGYNYRKITPDKLYTSHPNLSDSLDTTVIAGRLKNIYGNLFQSAFVENTDNKVKTLSAQDGTFALKARRSDTLQIFFQGLDTLIAVPERLDSLWEITLEPKSILLDEITVVSYGEQVKREMMSASVVTVNNLYDSGLKNDLPGNYKAYSGVVYAEADDEPLPGVSIIVIGTSQGTVTNLDGEFSIFAPQGAELKISYIGFVSKDIKLGSERNLSLSMEEDVQKLEELIVVGYGLQGRVSGVGISSGAAGENPIIRIRGNSTVSADKALIIIDGIPFEGGIEDLDPGFIQSINVLEGEAAASIYGVQAQNGAILITTGDKKAPIEEQNMLLSESDLSMAKRNKENSIRDNFSDEAFWVPDLVTDDRGEAKFQAKLPDDITGWETHVLASGPGKKTGSISTFIPSYNPVNAQLFVPQFLLEKDTVLLKGSLVNNTSDTVTASSYFKWQDAEKYTADDTFFGAKSDSVRFSHPVIDTLDIIYGIETTQKFFDGEKRQIPILPKGTNEVKGGFWVLSGDTTLTIPADSFEIGEIKATAKNSMIEALYEEINHVRNYNFECNEQLASKLLANLYKQEVDSLLNIPSNTSKEIKRILKKLFKNRKEDGSWGWWASSPTNVWMTNHVANALWKAIQLSELDKSMLSETIDYLKEFTDVVGNEDQLSILETLYAFGENLPYEGMLVQLEKDTLLNFSAYLRLQLFKKKLSQSYNLDTLKNTMKKTLKGNPYWGKEGWYVTQNAIQTSLLVFQLIADEPEFVKEREGIVRYLLERKDQGHWRNTYESIKVLGTILPFYQKQFQKSKKKDALLFEAGLTGEITDFPFSKALSYNGGNITIKKQGNDIVYLSLFQEVFNQEPQPLETYFEVKTHFAKDSSEHIAAKRGELLHLKTKVHVKQSAEYVMIEIPIPAGCFFDNTHIRSIYRETHREYYPDRLIIYCEKLSEGKYEFDVTLQTRFKGKFTVNPAKVSQMYFPILFGRNKLKYMELL
ncbi:MAG: carboxypeptidase-like regulatory domain-containing protein, partial [Bacteroidota bacterium]